MRKAIALVVGIAGMFVIAMPFAVAEKKPVRPPGVMATARLKISGMHCRDCALGITRQVEKVPGVKSTAFDHVHSLGVIEYDPHLCKPRQLVSAVRKSGYKVSLVK